MYGLSYTKKNYDHHTTIKSNIQLFNLFKRKVNKNILDFIFQEKNSNSTIQSVLL